MCVWVPVGPLDCSTLTDAGLDSVVCLHSHTAPSYQPARTYAATARFDAMLGMCSAIWAWGMSPPSGEAVKAALQHTAAAHCCRSQPRHEHAILIARHGRNGVYARCISRASSIVAAKKPLPSVRSSSHCLPAIYHATARVITAHDRKLRS